MGEKTPRSGCTQLLDVDPGQKPDKLGLTFRAGLASGHRRERPIEF
jgi:hypothetical protein